MKLLRIIAFILTSVLLTPVTLQSETMNIETVKDYALSTYGEPGYVKCGTPAIMQFLTDTSETALAYKTAFPAATRPEMQKYADSKEGHFRVHYDVTGANAPDLKDIDTNGVPDYVDSTLVFLEYAWKLIVDDLAYGTPVLDGTLGGAPKDKVDCYIKELSDGSSPLYGLTMPDFAIGGPTSAYLEIDNGFDESVYYTKGMNALKITTAHEFFHTIHYRYFGTQESLWWMEQSAVWMEDRAWNAVNDYINYLGLIFTDRNTPLDSTTNGFMYSATVFAMMIAHKHGDSMIRSIWQTIQSSQNGSIERLNAVLPDGLAAAISELSVWMYFTGYRTVANSFFPDAKLMKTSVQPETYINSSSRVDSLSFRHYTFKYIDISPAEGFSAGDSLYFKFTNKDNGLWSKKLIFYTSPVNYEVVSLIGDSSVTVVPRPFEKAVIAIANVSTINKNYRLTYSMDITSPKGVAKEPLPTLFAIEGNYPNPFNPSTTISFTLDNDDYTELSVFSLTGQKIRTLVSEQLKQGNHHVLWDGYDNKGSTVSSGVYIALLRQNGKTASNRMMLVK